MTKLLTNSEREYLLELEKIFDAAGNYQSAGMCVALLGGQPVSSQRPYWEISAAFNRLDTPIQDNGLDDFLRKKVHAETQELNDAQTHARLSKKFEQAPDPRGRCQDATDEELREAAPVFVQQAGRGTRPTPKEHAVLQEIRTLLIKAPFNPKLGIAVRAIEGAISRPSQFGGTDFNRIRFAVENNCPVISTDVRDWLDAGKKKFGVPLSLGEHGAPKDEHFIMHLPDVKPAPIVQDETADQRASRALDFLIKEHRKAAASLKNGTENDKYLWSGRLASLDKAIAAFATK